MVQHGSGEREVPESLVDGGHDIEGTLHGSRVWAAVGFRNSPKDSSGDKAWVRRKFNADLRSALEADGRLKQFVFLTNVDLTPGEIEALQRAGVRAGLEWCEIMHRERMRLLLDSPEGLAFRYQYLGVELSSAEQAAFFSRFEKDIAASITDGFDRLERQIERLELFNERHEPVHSVRVRITLRTGAPVSTPYRVLVVMVAESLPMPHPVMLAFTGQHRSGSGSYLATDFTVERAAGGAQYPPGAAPDRDEPFEAKRDAQVLTGAMILEPSGFRTFQDLDKLWLHLYVSPQALENVAQVELLANGYVLAADRLDSLVFEPAKDDDPFLELLKTGRHLGRSEAVYGLDSGIQAAPMPVESPDGWLEAIDGPHGGWDVAPASAFTDFHGYPPRRAR
jgi:hypothetical protein